jgi:RecA/RadA recombinase
MEQPKLLKELIHQIQEDNKLLSDHGNVARTSGIIGSKNNKARANDEVMHPLPLEGTTKEDIMRMVEATAMVYKVMEEQHKMGSFVPS